MSPLSNSSPPRRANRTRALLLTHTLSVCAFLIAGPVLAQPFACGEIKAILSRAEQDFSALKGWQLKNETAADYARANGLAPDKLDLEYLRRVHEAKKSLGAPVVASGEGTRDVSVEFESNPGDGTMLAIRKTVCLRKAPDGCDR